MKRALTRRRWARAGLGTLAGVVLALGLATTAAWGAFPGQNGRIAFSRVNLNVGAIYTMAPDGSDVQRLTFVGFNSAPSWSPDGTRIAFTSDRDGDDDIWVMNADGSDQRRVVNHPEGDFDPTWSPDGTQIAFTTDRDDETDDAEINYEIYVVRLADGTERPLTQLGQFVYAPAWAPDNSEIAFTNLTVTEARLFGVPPSGGAPRPITTCCGDDQHLEPQWAPDASRLTFFSPNAFTPGLWTVGRTGGRLSPLLENGAADDPAWSPDGLRIVFASDHEGNSEIYAMDASGGGVVRLTFDGAGDHAPDWQPRPVVAPPPAPPSPPPAPPPPGNGGGGPSIVQGDCSAGASEVLGNAVDEDCDGDAEGYPVVAAEADMIAQRFQERRRVEISQLTVQELRGGESISVTCRGRCSRNLPLRRRVTRRAGQLFLRRPGDHSWVATGTTVVVRITRAGFATRIQSFATSQEGAVIVERVACELPGGTDDLDCDGFRDLPVVRATARLSAAAGKRRTRLRTLDVRRLGGGETLALSCRGPGCRPALSQTTPVPAGTRRIRLDGNVRGASLEPGARLELTITRPGFSARVFRWTIRAGRAPAQQRLCQDPGERPGRCRGS